MTKVDYIVVGCGLAGIAFCEQLRTNNKSFLVFENASQRSSSVAVGLYNPVVLKRFTPVWKAEKLLDSALPYYGQVENLLTVKLDYKLSMYRRFSSANEQNQWLVASDKPALKDYLSTNFHKKFNPNINAPFGFGEVIHTGRIDTTELVKHYRNFLNQQSVLLQNSFDYNKIAVHEKVIQYEKIEAKYIVFAEGCGVKDNPYFKNLPLKVVKGEILIIKSPNLNLDVILKGPVFIVPLGNDHYAVGSTYNWQDQTNTITAEAKQELLNKLSIMISCDYEVVSQDAGIRPTVIDRRPLVGIHPNYSNVFVLNGLGTRGVMMAPFVAHQLYDFIENGKPLDKEIDIKRFVSLLE